jgi:hypothetical protein
MMELDEAALAASPARDTDERAAAAVTDVHDALHFGGDVP